MAEEGKKGAGPAAYLLIAHGNLAGEMLNALEFIAGRQPRFRALAIDHALDVDSARDCLAKVLDEHDSGGGVMILTDLFGGAPSNIALSFMDERNIEIVAGVNMPMLIHAATLDESLTLRQKADKLRDYGKNNVFVASEVLSGKKG
jgi:PTS system mannose-specific IIA component